MKDVVDKSVTERKTEKKKLLKICDCISLLKKTKTNSFIVGEKTMKKRSVLNIQN